MVWLDGPDAGSAFAGGAITVKAINYDTGSFYNGLPVGTSLGYGAGGASGSVAAGEAALAANQSRGVLGTAGAGFGPGSSEDSWGIIRITDILAIASDGVQRSLYSSAASSFELTAMFWGVTDFYMTQVDAGSGSAFAGQIIDGTGMRVDIYMDDTKNFSQTGGPDGRTAIDQYTSATDGDLVLSLLSTPGFINADGTRGGVATEFESNTGSVGYAALNVIGGDAETTAQFDTDAIGFGGSSGALFAPGLAAQMSTDVWFAFTSTQGVNGWDVTSNDPMLAVIRGPSVPDDTSTLGLIAGGLVLLGLFYRRQRLA
ncbi:MAG TPA: hypothetical protein VFT13_07785 [Candidatus Krumholzibacteria bacterium]|nr:hypothetical protein [Candidatus Krumholzibacteria bacterium]